MAAANHLPSCVLRVARIGNMQESSTSSFLYNADSYFVVGTYTMKFWVNNVLVVLSPVKAWTFFLWTISCLYRYKELSCYDYMKRLWNALPWQPIPWSCFPMSLYLLTAPRLPDMEIVFDTNKTPRVRHLLSPLGWRLLLGSWEHPFSLVKWECPTLNTPPPKNHEIFIWSLKATKFSCKVVVGIHA